MPRTPEEFARIREDSREKILESALELFAEHGFAGTSIRMLSEHAGVSQGLLYNYFGGKRELLRAILARGAEEVDRTFVAAESASSSESLAVLVESAFRAVRENPDFWRVTYHLRMQPDVLPEIGPEILEQAARIRARIRDLLEQAGADQPELRSALLFAAIDGAAQHYVLDPGAYPLDEVASELIRSLVPSRETREN